jgi:hypothetical protein
VTGGLKAGDRVIVEGLQLAQPGGKVDPQEDRPTAAPGNAPSRMHQGNGQPK